MTRNDYMTALSANLQAVRARIESACRRAGREPAEVRLLAVSKTFPADAVVEAAAPGFDLVEIGGGHRNLHRRGHGIGLVAIDRDGLASVEIERGDPDVAGTAGKQAGKLLLEALKVGAGRSQRRLRDSQAENPGEQGDNAHLGSVRLVKNRSPALYDGVRFNASLTLCRSSLNGQAVEEGPRQVVADTR